jgi:LuxR family transcriptional regulator, regulator of acetate metabolism
VSAALEGVGRALAELREPAPVGVVMDRGLRALCDHCGFTRALLFRVEGSELVGEAIHFAQRADWAAELLLETRRTPIPLHHMILETEMLRRRTAAIVSRPREDPRSFKPLVHAFETRAYVAAPLVLAGRVMGFLHADHHFEEGRGIGEEDRIVLATFAEGFGLALHRAVLLDRLSAQRAELERLLSGARDVTSHLGDDGAILARADEDVHASLRRAAAQRPTPNGAVDGLLTRREVEVLELMAAGATNGAIARELVVSEQTVKTHVSHVLRKLRATNRAEAVSRYHRLGNRVGGT